MGMLNGIILRGLVLQPFVEQTDACWVAAEDLVGDCFFTNSHYVNRVTYNYHS